MQKTSIEWVRNPDGSPGYTLNPMSGCENHTPEGLCLDGLFPCYAWKLAHGRLKSRYLANKNVPPIITKEPLRLIQAGELQTRLLDPFYPRFWEERLLEPAKGLPAYLRTKPKGIFVCDMGDLFGTGIPKSWTRRVLEQCKIFAQHRFYLLTKQAQELIQFSPFPENCFVGVTATNQQGFLDAIYSLLHVKATVRYISFEPLLSEIPMMPEQLKASCDLLIIGACTGNLPDMNLLADRYPDLWLAGNKGKITAQPKLEWVQEIVQAADKAGIPVFLKDNLLELVNYHSPETDFAFKDGCYRQEMPKTP